MRRRAWRPPPISLCLALLLCAPLRAAGEPPAAEATAPLTPQKEAEAQVIGALLRCPVCQGMPIAESPAAMAQDMMRIVRSQLQAGATQADIERYFVARYGTWVLLRPPTRGAALLIWLLPPLAVVAALAWGFRQLTSAHAPAATRSPSPHGPETQVTSASRAAAEAMIADYLHQGPPR